MLGSEHFSPADPHLFFRSEKKNDPRLGEAVRPYSISSLKKDDFILAGYPDDEGIKINQGRVGARLAPDAIRSRLYKTSLSSFHKNPLNLCDFGNLKNNMSLEERHTALKNTVHEALSQGHCWIGVGGGHDYGYPDGAGFLLAHKESTKKPLILNFDAHLDVRSTELGLSSGTPFYRLLTDDTLPAFDFYEIGIQRQCNSSAHIEWAQKKGAHILFYEDLVMGGESLLKSILYTLSEVLTTKRPTYISIDIDCFSTAFAMGASQAWPTGFSPNDLLPLLNVLYSRLDVKVLGIYEVSPPLDLDERTVKLASLLIHQFLGPLQ